MICGHDWQDVCGTAIKGAVGMSTVFVTLEVELFEHILKSFSHLLA